MSLRDAFLKALKKNEDDTTTRLVYADWLEEQGEHEEADRQRKWPAAKDWLVWICEQNNPSADHPDERFISYAELLELGQKAIQRWQSSREHNEPIEGDELSFSTGNNMGMCDALREKSMEFWKNWSIVTGIPLPPDIEGRTFFRCAC